jgi:hypothetical protein
MSVIITYDLTGKQDDVKKCMIEKSYADHFSNAGIQVDLPASTLFHNAKSPQQAIKDLEDCCTKYNVEIEKVIAVEFDTRTNSWSFK